VQGQLLLEAGIEDFDVQERGFRDGHSFRPYAQQSTQSRHKYSREALMPGKHLRNLRMLIVCRGVVQSPQKAFSIKVEGLRARVSYHAPRERYSELPQTLVSRNIARELLRFKIRIRENERGRYVIPDQVATIVREL
jgi:hypothetical protein